MNENKRDKNNQKQIDIPKFINYEDSNDSDSFIKNVNSSLADQVNHLYEDRDSGTPKKRRKKKGVPKLINVTLMVLLVLTVVLCFLMFTKPGQRAVVSIAGNYIYNNLEYEASETGEETSGDGTAIDNNKKVEVPSVINILLIGIEEFDGAQNTDSMMIATLNTETKSMKLTSLMRDLYVEIPGYDNNRLNSAYAKGGIELLYDTIEANFDQQLDGYCLVNFDAFESLVDMVGGVEITLTADEAEYLRTTNYISEKANRNVVEGTQLMNGNQALGYCRIRKVSTSTESNDFGRTQRQRIVLEAIYDKIKSKNVVSLVILMNDILTNVEIKTDITRTEFNNYLAEAVTLIGSDIETLRLPSDGTYENVKVKKGSRNVAVLQAKDWDATRKELHDFIYGAGAAGSEE